MVSACCVGVFTQIKPCILGVEPGPSIMQVTRSSESREGSIDKAACHPEYYLLQVPTHGLVFLRQDHCSMPTVADMF